MLHVHKTLLIQGYRCKDLSGSTRHCRYRSREMNISSAIVHAGPGQLPVVQAGLAGLEVHAVSPEGKLIVTIESTDDGSNVAIYEEIGRLQGVMSTAMVYHQIESEPDREVSVEADRRVEPQIKEI
jgi:periplasmic nitrate reductase NapD